MTAVKSYSYITGTPSGTPVTTSFGYSGDKLTSFGNKSITYNSNGGVTSYDGWNYTWNKGKLKTLRSTSVARAISIPPSKTYTFGYNAYGQRVSVDYLYLIGTGTITPTYPGEVTAYSKVFHYDQSGRLVAETNSKTLHNVGSERTEIVYLYDEGNMIGFVYILGETSNTYYYLRNLQGDVIAIYDTVGVKVAEYAYDAFGNCTITSTTNSIIAHANPIRYRGYYYDEDTGLYYCNARYYNPEWRRFISPDSTEYIDPESVNGLNLYVYCYNDPVNYADPTGRFAISLTILGLIVGAAVGTTVGGVAAYNIAKDQGAEGWTLFGWTMAGIVGGGIIGGMLGAATGAIVTKVTGILGVSIIKGNVFVVTKTMVLGHYGYTSLGASLGYGFYEISDDLYYRMNDAQRWSMNSQFLQDCSNLGANFIVEPTRVIAPTYNGNISYLYYEIEYLIKRGYQWLEDLSALVKGG